ncbi:hypothetical protein K4K49_000145 [Colletotrichum sp. SAR 10_70]|nr:hypothetical protein K4K50_009535 [Colletotrichum sp. SAR 10_71]KAI8191818.1 hypothetical protein K4K51_009984 [Colletotrichum sp. SAR 10_75]KAI8204906.1 hypothetical protein K4K49_000145 [Colletotrichum sp. SAR 10_70]KAI8205087.1 hypothetical protein KHU50_002225 [Colletotrichum sp. SAR 10_65]KAI8234886.1 hypothetical protein K4K54_007407 [Colletotrichum sp. SAR 10_86]KAI8264286.1 hypothetical protein K4K53_003574 [Colletotrichum sp. SAR 10_77]
MAPVQDIPSNGNDLVDSLDRLKVDDGEPRLGRVATMEKINHNGLANGKTMGYSMKKVNGNGLADGKTMGYNVRRGSFFTSSNMSQELIPSLHLVDEQRIKLGDGTDILHLAAQQRVKLTDNSEMPQPVLTTILGDGGFTGMFPVLITFAGLFANSSEVICTEVCHAVTADPCEGVQVTDEDFWNDIHIWTANLFSRRVLADKTCRALWEICIPLLFRKVRIYRAEYRAIQPLKAMLLNDRIQRSSITYELRARTSTPFHRALAMKRS